MTKLQLLLLGVATMGVAPFAYSADVSTQTPPCPQPPKSTDSAMCARMGDNCMPPPECCPMMGRMDTDEGRDGHYGRMDGGNGCMAPSHDRPSFRHDATMPKEVRDRIDALRADRKSLGELWEKAVLARGDKPVDELRDAFAKDNAALISKIDKSESAIRADIKALREGYAKDGKTCFTGPDGGEMGRYGPANMPFGGCKPDKTFEQVDADMVASIVALKQPLTLEEFRKIRDEAIAKNRKSLDQAFEKGGMYGMPMDMRDGGPRMHRPMSPELAHMRDEMGHMRGDFGAKRELRTRLREAMKIQDQAQREAAVKAILEATPDATDMECNPKPDAEPAKQ